MCTKLHTFMLNLYWYYKETSLLFIDLHPFDTGRPDKLYKAYKKEKQETCMLGMDCLSFSKIVNNF